MLIPVKARTGALVRHPFTKQLLPTVGGPEDPAQVEDTDLHFARLLADGDIVRVEAAAPPAPTKGASSSKVDPA